MMFRIALRIRRLLQPASPSTQSPSQAVDVIPSDADRTLVQPWPTSASFAPRQADPLHVFLFLQIYYLGGVWEATKDLVHQLVKINRERGQLRLTLGIHQDQTN